MPLLADIILVVHFAVALFIVGGLALIWLGALARWQWVRYWPFRVAHLAAIVFVAVEAMIGITCPLTEWEDALRGVHAETGFIERWVHALLFHDFPSWIFTAAYVTFAAVVAVTFWLIPPRRPSAA